jgi:hypothetical protein
MAIVTYVWPHRPPPHLIGASLRSPLSNLVQYVFLVPLSMPIIAARRRASQYSHRNARYEESTTIAPVAIRVIAMHSSISAIIDPSENLLSPNELEYPYV